MLPIPLFKAEPATSLLLTANYWFESDNQLFAKNLIPISPNVFEILPVVGSQYENYNTLSINPPDYVFQILDVTLNPNEPRFAVEKEGITWPGTEFTLFQVKRTPALTSQYATTVYETRVAKNYTQVGLSDITGISIDPPATGDSRFWLSFKWTNTSNANLLIIPKAANSGSYIPGPDEMYLDVVRTVRGNNVNFGPDGTYSTPNYYVTRNGYGSSGSPYHQPGSFISETFTTTSNKLIPAVNSVVPINIMRTSLDVGVSRKALILESIIFNRALSQSEIDVIETYLRQKYYLGY